MSPHGAKTQNNNNIFSRIWLSCQWSQAIQRSWRILVFPSHLRVYGMFQDLALVWSDKMSAGTEFNFCTALNSFTSSFQLRAILTKQLKTKMLIFD
jgi:hypothetical protein